MSSLRMNQVPLLRGLRGLGEGETSFSESFYADQQAASGGSGSTMEVAPQPDWTVRADPSGSVPAGYSRSSSSSSSSYDDSVERQAAFEKAFSETDSGSGYGETTQERKVASRSPARGAGSVSGSARGTVDQVRAQNKPIQQTVDRSQTTIYNPGIAARAQRVSPLAASWRFPISMPQSFGYAGRSSLGTKVALGVAVLLGAGALYYALKD